MKSIEALLRFAEAENLYGEFPEPDKLGRDAVRLAKSDDDSREDWKKRSEDAMNLALQVVGEKRTLGGETASNVKYPLITTAALQFHARAYPAAVQGNRVVRAQVTGEDPDGGKLRCGMRVSSHMNWQLLEENEDWEPDMDRLLLALPIEGCEFKKTYFSKDRGYNVSEWVRPLDLIVHNKTKSLQTCPRITHKLYYYPHEIDAKMLSGVWRTVDLGLSPDQLEEEVLQEFYEQHCYYDLNEDGYKEPYIVTVHVESEKVVRIVSGYQADDIIVRLNGQEGPIGGLAAELARSATPEQAEAVLRQAELVKVPRLEIFTKYSFIPSPDGSFYDIGFGQLIGPLSDAVDTNINQLIDAGSLANMQAGFVRDGVSIEGKRGVVKWERGKFVRIKVSAGSNIGDSIFQMKFNEPSMVLFQLLGTLIQAAKDVTSVQDIMLGQTQGKDESATTSMIRIEQGLKVFSAIYKRIYRALKEEFRKLFKLNSRYLRPEQYFTVLDTQEPAVVTLSDYRGDGTDIQPVADPQLATALMAMAKNQALLQIMQHPLINDEEVLRRYLEGMEIPDPMRCFVPPDQRQAPPDPELVLKAQIAASEHVKRQAEIVRMYADALNKIAEAESKEAGIQLQAYANGLKSIIEGWNGQRQFVPMEAAPGNGGVPGIAQGNAGLIPGGGGGGGPVAQPGGSAPGGGGLPPGAPQGAA